MAIKEPNAKEAILDDVLKDFLLEELKINSLHSNYQTSEKMSDKEFQFRPNTFSQDYITNKL